MRLLLTGLADYNQFFDFFMCLFLIKAEKHWRKRSQPAEVILCPLSNSLIVKTNLIHFNI